MTKTHTTSPWQIIPYFLRQFIFWLLFFASERLVFFLYNFTDSKLAGISDILLSFWHALYLDISMACYFMLLPFLLLLFQSLFKLQFLNQINRWQTYLILPIAAMIYASELGIYEEWHEKLSFKAIAYLERPSEAFNSAKTSILLLASGLVIAFTTVGIFLYNKFVHKNLIIEKRNFIFSGLWFLLMPGIILLGLRGGVQQIPISQSAVYFSKNNFVNLATVNSVWNLAFSIQFNSKFKNHNPFIYYDFKEAKAITDSLYRVEKDTTIQILNTKNPNIVLVMLESWSGDLVGSIGGYKGITPNFDKIAENGLLFTKNYSVGMLSHQAVVAIYSAFPSTPEVDIIKHADKYEGLNCFIKDLKGYSTSFYFGGELNYGNIKSYIYFNGFENIVEGKDFENVPDKIQGKMGVHDQGLYNRLLADIKQFKTPFFCGAFTLSSHSPFDFPMDEKITWGDAEMHYLNSVLYADKALGEFVQKAKNEDWYDNTLFILTADHSHPTPKKRGYYSVEQRHTPMLFFGNALKEEYRGTTYNGFSNQTDIAATLLAQLGKEHDKYQWSRNLFNPYINNFIYYGFEDGFGWVEENGNYMVYNERENWGILEHKAESKKKKEQMLRNGKAYLQILFQEFLDY